MQLRDMLSSEMADKLKSIKGTENRDVKPKVKSKGKVKKKSVQVPEAKITRAPALDNTKISDAKKKPVVKKEKPEKPFVRYINECPYCGSHSLEKKPNGYVLCEDCGIDIEKI